MNFYNRIIGGSGRSATVRRNVIGSILIKGVSIAVSFFIVPLTLGFVDKELYGIWLTLSSIVIWLNFFDVGFTPGLQNKLSEAIALDEWDKAHRLVSSTYAILSAIFIPLMIILFIAIPWIDWCGFLNIQDKYRLDVVMTMYPLVTCFCLQMVLKIITTVIASFQKTAFSTSFNVLANMFSLLIIIILPYVTKPSLFVLSLAISTMPIVVLSVASLWLYNSRFKRVKPSIKLVDFQLAKSIFGLGGKFFIIQIQGIILYQTTNVLISNIASPTDVSVYNIAYKYLSTGMMFYSIFMGPLWPAFTDAYTKKDYSWMKRMYRKMSYVCLLTIFGFILMTIISPVFYKIWIGDKLTVPFMMTFVVAIYMAVHSWDMLQVTLVNGMGKIKLQTYVVLLGLFLNIPLSFFFGKFLGLGGIGVTLSMTTINIIYSIFFTIQINLLLNQKAKGIWNK